MLPCISANSDKTSLDGTRLNGQERRSRLLADISELNLAKGSTIVFPEGKDKLLKFEITLRPDEGIYRFASWLHYFKSQLSVCDA